MSVLRRSAYGDFVPFFATALLGAEDEWAASFAIALAS
jgi:hypothetical protein